MTCSVYYRKGIPRRSGDIDHTLQTWVIDWIDPLECLFVLTDISLDSCNF